jgi:hypothetical protein
MRNQVTEMIRPTAITALAYHGIQAAGSELWKLFQGVENEGQERIEQ